MIKSYRIELKPTKEQIRQFQQHCGAARFAYNWTLKNHNLRVEQAKKEALERGLEKPNYPKVSSNDWYKEFAKFRDLEENTWILEVSKCCWQASQRNLESAFNRFFSKKGNWPKEKKRGQHDSFTVYTPSYVGFDYIKIPKIGKVKLKEKGYATDVKVSLSYITITREADRWFCSFYIKNSHVVPTLPMLDSIYMDNIVGVDLGVKDLAVTSDADVFENPKAYNKYQKRMKRLQRKFSRQQKGSNSRKKTTRKLQRLHRRIKNIRKDHTNKMTSSITNQKPKLIVIESLKPVNMSKNHKLANSILDASFGEIGRQFSYKSTFAGVHLIKAPQFYPSSQFCSCCGYQKKDLKLSDREWECPACHEKHDRDFNAAKNLQFFGWFLLNELSSSEGTTGSFPGSNVSGDERFQFLRKWCSSEKLKFYKGLKNYFSVKAK